MSKLSTPKAACNVTTANGQVEFSCVDCGEVRRHPLPDSLDVVLQRGTDFSNYHRWCGAKSVKRATKDE